MKKNQATLGFYLVEYFLGEETTIRHFCMFIEQIVNVNLPITNKITCKYQQCIHNPLKHQWMNENNEIQIPIML